MKNGHRQGKDVRFGAGSGQSRSDYVRFGAGNEHSRTEYARKARKACIVGRSMHGKQEERA